MLLGPLDVVEWYWWLILLDESFYHLPYDISPTLAEDLPSDVISAHAMVITFNSSPHPHSLAHVIPNTKPPSLKKDTSPGKSKQAQQSWLVTASSKIIGAQQP